MSAIRRHHVLLVALAAIMLHPAPAQAGAGCHSTRCIERVARKHCDQHHVVDCIHRAALHWHQSFRDLLRVAKCESGLDPYQRNRETATGVFQFLDSTWLTQPYRSHSVRSAKWNSLAAGWMWAHGRRGEWVCT